jgi:hypothetical protein
VLQLEQRTRADAACQAVLDAVTQGRAQADDGLERLCRTALAAGTGAQAAALAGRYRAHISSSWATQLWADAALRGDAPAWLGLARQLDQDAGPADADFAVLDAGNLAAAQAAAQRAATLNVPDAADELLRLQDREFPLRGARLEPLWRALYFRQFDAIPDGIDNRRHVAGFTLGVAHICERWELSIRTVRFDAALEIYLAPVRGQVPERVIQAVPQVGRTLAGAAREAREGAAERSVAGWIEQGLRIFHSAKRDVRNAVAIGSSDGRHAAQMLFNSSQSCRAPRGQKMMNALADYFVHMQNRSPLPSKPPRHRDAAPTVASRKE